MDEQAPTAVGGPKVMAFRIIAGLFGVITVLAMIGSAIPVLTNDQDKVHSFHVLGVIPVYVLLAGLPLIVLALPPTDVVATLRQRRTHGRGRPVEEQHRTAGGVLAHAAPHRGQPG